MGEGPGEVPGFVSDKREGTFNWRDANRFLRGAQDLRSAASSSQDFASIVVESDASVAVLALSDTHIGDWATDHDLFERITDEILSTPNLYVALLGDLAQMAIKLRNVSEVSSNLLPPDLQLEYISSWLDEIQHKVLFATWDNHAVEREESQSGISAFARLLSKRVVYHAGIGHPDIHLGDQLYHLAVSHRFRGSSIDNPVHAVMRYLRREGHDREVGIMGDYHVPGIAKFVHGPTTKVAVNCGTLQLSSTYARRHFSLFSHPVMPVIRLDRDTHLVTPFWSLAELRAAGGV